MSSKNRGYQPYTNIPDFVPIVQQHSLVEFSFFPIEVQLLFHYLTELIEQSFDEYRSRDHVSELNQKHLCAEVY